MAAADSRPLAGGSDNRWRAHVLATFTLGLPLIGAQMAGLAIHTTDVVIMGRLGAAELAAMVLSGQYLFTIFIFGAGFGNGVLPMVAQAFGRGDQEGARHAMRMGLWVSIAYWLAVQPLYYHAEGILIWLGQDPKVANLAGRYIAVAQWSTLPNFIFLILRSLVSAIHRTGVILWSTIVTLVINAFLAYGMVLGHFGFPAYGMQAAAYVAILAQGLGLAVLWIYIEAREDTRRFGTFRQFWKPDWPVLKEVIHLGLPIGISFLAETTLFTVASLLMGWIGTLQLAAHGIAMQLVSMAFMIPLGLAQVATVRVGHAVSQRDHVGLVRASWTVVAIAAVIAIAGGSSFALMPKLFAGLFIPPDKPDAEHVLAFAVSFITVGGIFQIVDGLQAIASGLLRGLKDARVPMMLALIAYWPVGFGLAYVLAFPAGFAGVGIWLGFLIGLLTASVLLLTRYSILVRRVLTEI